MNARLLACALSLGCADKAADTAAAGFDPALAAALQETLDAARSRIDAPGATLTFASSARGAWSGASGESDVAAGAPAQPGDRFRIGSITKTFVAAAVLQIEGEGLLALDDPLTTWVPDAPHADAVTYRQLLNHTAGYEDYVEDLGFLASLDVERTPWELLAFIEGAPLRFEPGADFAYSNTHYVLLGMAMEAAEGEDYAASLRRRFLDPLGLDDTSLPSHEEEPPRPGLLRPGR